MILYSGPYFLLFLSGYLPLAVHAALLALIFTLLLYSVSTEKIPIYHILLKLIVPLSLAGMVVLPLILAIVKYHKLVTVPADTEWIIANQLAYSAENILALLIPVTVLPLANIESKHVTLGLIPVLTMGLLLIKRKQFSNISRFNTRLILVSLIIFIFHLLLACGQPSGLAGMFYYLIPALGKMHMYGRYLICSSFFFFLGFAIITQLLVSSRVEFGAEKLALTLLGLAIFLLILATLKTINYDVGTAIAIYLFLTSLFFFAIAYLRGVTQLLFIIGIPFIMNFAEIDKSFQFGNSSPKLDENTVVFSKVRSSALNNYFKANTNKLLIKYVDLSFSIEKFNGVMLNYPWMVQQDLAISNYMGYELHLAIDKDYLIKFPWFGIVDIPWLKDTGADFALYDAPAWQKYSEQFTPLIDHTTPILDIGYGYKIAKLIHHPLPTSIFDNGLIRASSEHGALIINNFSTNFSSFIKFNVDSPSVTTIKYLLFPNKYLQIKVDGKLLLNPITNGFFEFTVTPGKHLIEYYYKNTLQKIFIILAIVYLILLILILLWRACVIFLEQFFD